MAPKILWEIESKSGAGALRVMGGRSGTRRATILRRMEGLPGLLAVYLPDAWGRRVAQADFAKNKWGEPTPMALLAWHGKRGLWAVFFEPPMESGNLKLEKINLAALAKGALEIERGEPCEILPLLA